MDIGEGGRIEDPSARLLRWGNERKWLELAIGSLDAREDANLLECFSSLNTMAIKIENDTMPFFIVGNARRQANDELFSVVYADVFAISLQIVVPELVTVVD